MHDFIQLVSIPKWIVGINDYMHYLDKDTFTYKICNNCDINIFINHGRNGYVRWFLNQKEIYSNLTQESEFPFSCQELIIKNLLE